MLDRLVKSKIWASNHDILRFQRLVLDVDSIINYLYRLSLKRQLHLQKSGNGLTKCAVSLINYIEYAKNIKLLFQFFHDHGIEPLLVYRGKQLEAPLFGLLAAQFTENTSLVSDRLKWIKSSTIPTDTELERLTRPNLALIIFKMVVRKFRKMPNEASGFSIRTFQAFYHQFPLMARLARDYQCPVLTNDGHFILYDVRAGFVLFDEFWFHHVELHDLVINRDKSQSRSVERKGGKSPKGKLKLDSRMSGSRRSPKVSVEMRSSFHYHALFLVQHPGMTSYMSMCLLALINPQLISQHSASLKRLKIYDKEYRWKELSKPSNRRESETYQAAANRLEMAIRFTSETSHLVLGSLIRGEADRLKSSLNQDYSQLFNYYSGAHEFKFRLRHILKTIWDPLQLNFVEWCLTNRDCSADFLLELLVCSIGHISGVTYNKNIQFEDTKTKCSAMSVIDRVRIMSMSLMNGKRSHSNEKSTSSSNSRSSSSTEVVNLTVVDRQSDKIVDRVLPNLIKDSKLEGLANKITLRQIAGMTVKTQDTAKFLNLVFDIDDLTSIKAKRDSLAQKHIGDPELLSEYAIVNNLCDFSISQASREDKYFVESYKNLINHFKVALLNHYIYRYRMRRPKEGSKVQDRDKLVQFVARQNLENVAQCLGRDHDSKEFSSLALQTRHLSELLNSGIESYCELNAFLNYPLPSLKLYANYNPILIYNFTIHSVLSDSKTKILISGVSTTLSDKT